jgi:hypothetical protein
MIWSLTVSIGTSSRTYLSEAVDLFIYPYLISFECFLSLGAATYKECPDLWVLGSTSELVNLTILAKKFLSL